MAVVETLDIMLGAKTQQADSALRDSINNTKAVKREFDGLSSSMGVFEPITVAITSSITDMISAIPGVSAGIQVFQATAAAVNAIFAARQVSAAAQVEKSIEAVKKKSTDAVQEIRIMAKELERAADAADDIVDVDYTVISSGAKRLSNKGNLDRPNALIRSPVGKMRSPEMQQEYIKHIDRSILERNSHAVSSWKETATASRAALGIGKVGALGLAAGVGVAVAAVGSLALAWRQVNAQSVAIDEISDSASKLGMSFRDLSTLRFSLGESSGLDAGSIDNAIQKMTIGLSSAASSQSGDLFDKLTAAGLNAGELLKMGPAKAMEDIAAKTQMLQNPTDQLVLAYELFGKQGAAIVSSLREGPEAMREQAAWAERTGMNLSNAQAEQVGAANDAWDRMTMVATGAFRQIAAEASPVLRVIYEQIANGAVTFSDYLKYLPDIVDNTVYFAGVLYDVYELSRLTQTTLYNIVTLNWSEVGKDIESAFTFDTGAKNLEKIQKAREEALESAGKKEANRGDKESQFAAYEAQKQAAKEAAEAQKQAAKEQKQIEDEKRRAAQQAEAAVKKRFDAVRQEIEIQKILGTMSAKQAQEREQEVRERVQLHAELREHGMFNFSQIDALTNAANEMRKQNELRQQLQSKADDINKQFNPAIQLRETMAELDQLFQRGMINRATYVRAAHDAGKKDMPEYKGAVSVQAKSVEAYKLLLDRENSNRNDQLALRRAVEASVGVQREMLVAIEAIEPVGSAR